MTIETPGDNVQEIAVRSREADEAEEAPEVAETGRYVYLPLSAAHIDYEINLVELWRAIIGRKLLVALVTLALLLPATVFAFLMNPIYVAEVSMTSNLSTESEQDSTQSSSDAEVYYPAMGTTEVVALAILESRAFTEAFIEDEDLMPILFDQELTWAARLERLLPAWMLDKWEWPRSVLKSFRPKQAKTMWDAFEVFNEDVRAVEQDDETGMTVLTIEWSDPTVAAEWANMLVARINAHVKKRDIEFADKSLAYLYDELGRTSVLPVQQSLYDLIEQSIAVKAIANVRDEYALKVIDPAVVPEEEEWTFIKRAVVVIGVGMLGIILGSLLALFQDFLRRQRAKLEERGGKAV